MEPSSFHHHQYYRRLMHDVVTPDQPDEYQAYLDKTLSIAFVSFFCASVSYLILHSIFHCLCRRRRRGDNVDDDVGRHHHDTVTIAEEPPDKACMVQLRVIPVLVFGDHLLLPPSSPSPLSSSCSNAGSSEQDESCCCPVCLGEYEKGEEVRVLPRCRHMFHRACIDRWLTTRSSFCPICRDRVIDRAAEPSATRCGNGNRNSPSLHLTMGTNVVASHLASIV